jgi:prephenate dehydratase
MNVGSKTRRIAFQGEPGAFSEAAIAKLAPDAEAVPCATFESLFSAIRDGRADFILVPVENTLIGPIEPVQRLLAGAPLKKVDEVSLRIEHHLIGIPGTTLSEIRIARSHMAALAQCKKFFAAHPQICKQVADDTAGSVREVLALGKRSVAAIAGERVANIYKAEIILRNIEDDPSNHTRFVLFSAEP